MRACRSLRPHYGTSWNKLAWFAIFEAVAGSYISFPDFTISKISKLFVIRRSTVCRGRNKRPFSITKEWKMAKSGQRDNSKRLRHRFASIYSEIIVPINSSHPLPHILSKGAILFS